MYKNERYVITGVIYDLNGLKSKIDDEYFKKVLERSARKLQDLVDDHDYYMAKKEKENANA